MSTIRQQLTRNLLLALGALIGGVGVAVYLCAQAALMDQFDTALLAKAQALMALTEAKGSRVENEFSENHRNSFDAGGSDYFELQLADGKMVERSRSLGDAHLLVRYGTPHTPVFWNLPLPGGVPGRAAGIKFRPQQDNEHPTGAASPEVILVVATHRGNLDSTLITLKLVLAGGGALLLAATALVVPPLLRRGMTPLRELADHAERIDAASLSDRFPTTSLPGELVPITARLNGLLARLEDSFERERGFSSNVAHEFRTPIAELRALAELAIKLPDTRTADHDREVLAIALHLESVLTRLLTLARGERSELPGRREKVALAPLIENICRKIQGEATARQLAFQWHVPAEAVTFSDPVLLHSILTNLVENAVEYTPLAGAVHLAASVERGRLTVRLVNSVENLDERDLPRLFDPFWRKDDARTNDGHTGLGLSLARTFARALGCELTAAFASPAQLAVILTETAVPAPAQQTQA